MRTTARAGSAAEVETPLLVVPRFQAGSEAGSGAEGPPPELAGLDEVLGGTLSRALSAGDFSAKRGETQLLYRSGSSGPERVFLVGLGPRAELSEERLRELGGVSAKRAQESRVAELCVAIPNACLSEEVSAEGAGRALAEGLELGGWRFEELRGEQGSQEEEAVPLEVVEILAFDDDSAAGLGRGADVGGILGRAQNYARELAVRPGNIVTPTYLADQAQALGKEFGFKVAVLGPAALEKEGMGAVLAVAAGSDEEPRFIVIEYKPGAGQPLVLVGKGVTFDSGGLSLKPPAGMESMKYDMSGAASVLGAMKAIGELEPEIGVVGLIPSVENLPSAHAMRPGDVIKSHSGTTIEVLNTDAEGRLILADALSYASRFEPRAMIDAATLTGACVIALGHHAIGLMGSDEGVVDQIKEAAERCGERVWELPLWSEYREQLKSDIADIKNTGGRPAGTITAGLFLREFAGSIPWAHLDIAGMAWANEAGPYQPKGPTGVGVRLFAEWVMGQAG